MDLEAHGKGTFDSATKGNTETVLESNPVRLYELLLWGVCWPQCLVVASCEAQGVGMKSIACLVHGQMANHLENHASLPGYEDTGIKEVFGEDMKMSNQLYTLQRWARWPEEDFAGWCQNTPLLTVRPEYPLVWSLPEGIRTKWYWKESVKEYLQLHGYDVPASADAEQLDKLVEHVIDAKLPLLHRKTCIAALYWRLVI